MTAVSKNVYFNKLNEIINKHNNTVYRTMKMNPIHVTPNSYAEYSEDSNKKDPKFKVEDCVRVSKYKSIYAKIYVPNCSEEVFAVNKIKNTAPWIYVISDLNGEEIVGSFYEKKLQETSQEKFRIEKVIKRKDDKLYVKRKDTTIRLIVGFIKTTLYKISQYFHKPFRSSGRNINANVDLSNYATELI